MENVLFRPCMKELKRHGELLASTGKTFLSELGVDVGAARQQRRLFARRCLDWTEGRYHLGGALGGALARRCFEMEWIQRNTHRRSIRVTANGAGVFRAYFGLADLT